MGKFIALFVLIAAILLVFIFVFKINNTSSFSSTSTVNFNSPQKVGGTAGQVIPVGQPVPPTSNVSCAVNGSVILNPDGTKQVQFGWTVAPNTQAYITDSKGVIVADIQDSSSVGTSSVYSAPITSPTSFILVDNGGIATSTCNITADPATAVATH